MLPPTRLRGIGAAIVKACARENATVYMTARRMDAAQKIADEFIRTVDASLASAFIALQATIT